MAASPKWKVYDSHQTYQAACKEICAAACLMGLYGDGAEIRHGHSLVVWTQGARGDGDAGDSYDVVEEIIWSRIPEPKTF